MAQSFVQVTNKVPKSETGTNAALTFPIQLVDLDGIGPIGVEFDPNATIKDMAQKLKKIVDIDTSFEFVSRFTENNKIPKSYPLIVGDENIIDFAGNEFKISPNTRFIEYWNDFLDESKLYDEEKKFEQTEGYIKYEGDLSVMLEDDILTIGDAKIQFQRTLRIPEDGKTYPLPPGLGKFPIGKVQDFMNSDGLPSHWKKRKGVILPMLSNNDTFSIS